MVEPFTALMTASPNDTGTVSISISDYNLKLQKKTRKEKSAKLDLRV